MKERREGATRATPCSVTICICSDIQIIFEVFESIGIITRFGKRVSIFKGQQKKQGHG